MQSISSDQLNNDFDSSLWPELTNLHRASQQGEANEIERIRVSMHVNDRLSYFKGHFPEQAVLPGVVQIHWAAKLAQLFWSLDDTDNQALKLKKVKFVNPVLPGYFVNLELQHTAFQASKVDCFKIDFSYSGYAQEEPTQSNSHQRFSSGLLEFPAP